MWSSGTAFLYLTSCSARAVPGLQRGDVRVVKLFLVFDISPVSSLSLPLCECLTPSEVRSLSLCIRRPGGTDDQTWAWESGAVALHDGGSHLLPSASSSSHLLLSLLV